MKKHLFFLWLQSVCKSFPLFSYTNANEADFVLYLLHPHDIPCSFLFFSFLSELMVKQRQLFMAPNDVTVDFCASLFFFCDIPDHSVWSQRVFQAVLLSCIALHTRCT